MQGRSDPSFDANWGVVKDWSEQARYQVFSMAEEANIYSAISDRQHGVLRWIKRF
jgi:hypothetical protein